MHRRPTVGFRCTRVVGRRRVTLPVIPRICPLCVQQTQGKPISLYWAWTVADGRRRAWKQKVCAACFEEHFVRLVVTAMEPILICPACGIGTVDDYDAVYLSYFIPGMSSGQSEMPLCGPCAVAVRNKALEGAAPLEDRGVGVGGPQPQAPGAAAMWEALGLRPK